MRVAGVGCRVSGVGCQVSVVCCDVVSCWLLIIYFSAVNFFSREGAKEAKGKVVFY